MPVPQRAVDAGDGVVSGTVSDSTGNPIFDVTITALDPATGDTEATTMSAADGTYTFSVPLGPTNFTFDPPSGSPLGPAASDGVDVTSTTTLDVILTPPETTDIVSGTLLDSLGNPIVGATITFSGCSTDQACGGFPATTTAADGSWNVSLAPGTYYSLEVQGGTDDGLQNPGQFYLQNNPVLDITGPTTINMTIPNVTTLTLTVVSPSNQPQADDNVYIFEDFSWSLLPGGALGSVDAGSYGYYTGADGTLTADMFDGQTAQLFAQPNSSYGAVDGEIDVSGPTTTTLTMAPTDTVSGTVLDPSGNAVANANVELTGCTAANPTYACNEADSTATTASDGSYTLSIPAGSYGQINIDTSASTDGAISDPQNSSVSGSSDTGVTVSGPTTMDLTTPDVTTLTTTVEDAAGSSVSGVPVVDEEYPGPSWSVLSGFTGGAVAYRGSAVDTGVDGTVTQDVWDGGSAETMANQSQFYSESTQVTVQIAGPTSATVQVTGTDVVSGVLEDTNGTPISGAVIYFDGCNSNPTCSNAYGEGTTGADGSFSLTVPDGVYEDIAVQAEEATDGSSAEPGDEAYFYASGSLDVDGPTTISPTLPDVTTLTTTVDDTEGNPLADINISTSGGFTWPILSGWSGDGSGQNHAVTSANGVAVQNVFDGETATVEAKPTTSSSLYGTATVSVAIDGPTTRTIALTGTPITITVSGSQNYGSSTSTLTYTSSVAGVSLTGTLSCVTVDSGTEIAATLPVATDTVDGSSCSGLSAPAGYSVSYVGETGGYVVSPDPLVVTASSAPMTYGGAVPVITPKYSGFVNGDSAASLGSGPTCSAPGVSSSSPVGTYSTSCTGAVDDNYTFEYVTGTLTTGPASLTVTATSPSMDYGGSVPAVSARYSGFVNGQSASSLNPGPACSAPGVNASTGVGSYTTSCSGAVDDNYTITYGTGTLTVAPLPSRSRPRRRR
jgi:hypothetical protein